MALSIGFEVINGGAPTRTLRSVTRFLQDLPRSAYTGVNVSSNLTALDLDFHARRLLETQRLMSDVRHVDPLQHPHLGSLAELTVDMASCRSQLAAHLGGVAGALRSELGDTVERYKCVVALVWFVDTGMYDMYCHATPITWKGEGGVHVHFYHRSPRTNALAKDSEWVVQRGPLEAAKPEGASEVIIVDEGGDVFEGLTSNFYAVIDGKVHTADRDVLQGATRAFVLDECRALGIEVVLQCPNVDRMSTWSAAFITSTTRLVWPINKVTIEGTTDTFTLDAEDPLLVKLKTAVGAHVEQRSSPLPRAE